MATDLFPAPIAFLAALSAVLRPPLAFLLPPAFRSPRPFQLVGKRRRSVPLLTASAASDAEDEGLLKKLPDKKKPLYSHSLPCIVAWLRKLGFRQSRNDRAVWLVEKPEWHAQLSLVVTDLPIKYLKSGSADLEKDVERRFSYALSREDIENAILGRP